MTQTEKGQFVGGLVSLAVYIVVAWIAAKVLDVSVWRALAALLVARAFFGVVEWVVGIVNWRLFGKRSTVRGFLEVLRSNSFPQRFNRDDDFLNYLARIESGEYPEALKRSAQEFEKVLGAIESQGIMAGARIHAASEVALEEYSPRLKA